MRHCTGRGRSRCQAYGDVLRPQPTGGTITDAVSLCDEWLDWYACLPWYRRAWR